MVERFVSKDSRDVTNKEKKKPIDPLTFEELRHADKREGWEDPLQTGRNRAGVDETPIYEESGGTNTEDDSLVTQNDPEKDRWVDPSNSVDSDAEDAIYRQAQQGLDQERRLREEKRRTEQTLNVNGQGGRKKDNINEVWVNTKAPVNKDSGIAIAEPLDLGTAKDLNIEGDQGLKNKTGKESGMSLVDIIKQQGRKDDAKRAIDEKDRKRQQGGRVSRRVVRKR